MKKTFLPLLLFFCGTAALSQTTKWDSTFRPNNYAQRVANFRSYPNATSDIIFLGNSITDFTDWNELLQLPQARNRGISGDITFGILERLDEVIEGKPSKIFLLIGINDISRNIPDSVILDNYRKMIRRIRAGSPTTRIYIHTLLPVNNSFGDRGHFNKDEHLAAVNDGIKQMGKAQKIIIIDIHPQFLDADKKLDKRFTYDGLHLNAEGYKKWAAILKPYIVK